MVDGGEKERISCTWQDRGSGAQLWAALFTSSFRSTCIVLNSGVED